MAEVYLGRVDGIEGFRKLVAIKLIHGHLAESPEFVTMFLNEARIAASLDHPNVCNVLDLGEVQGEHFIAMEYIHGESLRALLRTCKGEPMPLPSALCIVLATCSGLHYVHEHAGPDGKPRHLVHRDISPSNIMLRFDGGVKIVDFGIAKAVDVSGATTKGTIKGKAAYMSPEQTFAEPVDRRSDVFSLGIVLYEVTTGRRMFYGDNEMAVMNRIVDGRFDHPSAVVENYPKPLEDIVLRAVAADPDDRFPTAEAMQSALEEFVREHRIAVSKIAVRDLMLERFGDQPYPTTAVDEVSGAAVTPVDIDEAATTVIPSSGPRPPSKLSRRGAVIGLGLVGIGGALGLAFNASFGSADEKPAASDPMSAEIPAADPAAEVRPDLGAALEPEPDTTAEPTQTVLDVGGAAVPPKPRSKRRRTKKKKGRTTAASSKRGSPTRDPMRPL